MTKGQSRSLAQKRRTQACAYGQLVSLPCNRIQQFVPTLQVFLVLFRREAVLWTPFLESVIFGTAAVIIFLQHFLAFRAQKKIRHEQRSMRMGRIRRDGGATDVCR